MTCPFCRQLLTHHCSRDVCLWVKCAGCKAVFDPRKRRYFEEKPTGRAVRWEKA